jgi:hypothetical protein
MRLGYIWATLLGVILRQRFEDDGSGLP